MEVAFELRFAGLDYAALEATGELAAIRDELAANFATAAGVPPAAVRVALAAGSVVAAVGVRFEGAAAGAAAEAFGAEVRDFSAVAAVLVASDTLGAALAAEPGDLADPAAARQVASLDGDVAVQPVPARGQPGGGEAEVEGTAGGGGGGGLSQAAASGLAAGVTALALAGFAAATLALRRRRRQALDRARAQTGAFLAGAEPPQGGGGNFPFFLEEEGGASPQRRSVAVTNPLAYL